MDLSTRGAHYAHGYRHQCGRIGIIYQTVTVAPAITVHLTGAIWAHGAARNDCTLLRPVRTKRGPATTNTCRRCWLSGGHLPLRHPLAGGQPQRRTHGARSDRNLGLHPAARCQTTARPLFTLTALTSLRTKPTCQGGGPGRNRLHARILGKRR